MIAKLAHILTRSAALAGLALAAHSSANAQQYGPVDDSEPNATVTQFGVEPDGLPQSLVDAVNSSLEQSPLVLARLAELAALQADLRTARRLRYPNLTAEILANTGGSRFAADNGLAINLALEQPVWTGGAIASQIDAARATRESGYNALREARLEVLLGVVGAYFDALIAAERIKVLETGIEQYRQLTVSIERRVAQQVSPYADLTLALSRLNQLEIELMAARELSEDSRARLLEFVAEDITAPQLPDEQLANALPDEAVAVQDMMACAPALDRLRSEIDVARANARTTRGNILPQLLLQLSQNEITGSRAAIVLRAETGNGLNRLTAIDSAEARVDQAVAELGQADRDMRTRIRREFVAYRSNQRREEASAQTAQAASDLLASYQRQFAAGRRSWLDVLNAAREVTDARVSQSDARVIVAASAVRILVVSCRWRPAGV